VAAARAALRGDWGRMALEKRCALLHAVADEITRRFDDFVAAEEADTGQPHHVIAHAFVPRGAANFKVFADVVKNVPTESFRMDTPDGRGALNYAIRKPKGVVGVISPWNAPFLLMTWKVGPALACGNAVVVKPSEETPMTAALLGEVMNAVGIPKGVYNVVHGFGPDAPGAFITQHEDVDATTFTGAPPPRAGTHQAAALGLWPRRRGGPRGGGGAGQEGGRGGGGGAVWQLDERGRGAEGGFAGYRVVIEDEAAAIAVDQRKYYQEVVRLRDFYFIQGVLHSKLWSTHRCVLGALS